MHGHLSLSMMTHLYRTSHEYAHYVIMYHVINNMFIDLTNINKVSFLASIFLLNVLYSVSCNFHGCFFNVVSSPLSFLQFSDFNLFSCCFVLSVLLEFQPTTLFFLFILANNFSNLRICY